ncbi:unnamed protein product [Boreogadus saida]
MKNTKTNPASRDSSTVLSLLASSLGHPHVEIHCCSPSCMPMKSPSISLCRERVQGYECGFREGGRRSHEEPPNMLHLNVVGDLLRAVDRRRRDVLFSVRAG